MLFTDTSLVESFETELADIKAAAIRLQARQLVILNQLERARVAQRDGARSMAEWTATTLDVTAGTARELVAAANRIGLDRWLFEQMEAGEVTLEGPWQLFAWQQPMPPPAWSIEASISTLPQSLT